MKALVLVALVACGGHGQTPPGGDDAPPTDPAVCESEFQASLDRKCTLPTDCTLVRHTDCCGDIVLGISTVSSNGYPALETQFEVCRDCPPLGCAHADLAEDGMTAQNGQAIVADCVASRCASHVQ